MHHPPREIPEDPGAARNSVLAHHVGDFYDALGRSLLRWKTETGRLWAPQRHIPKNHTSGDVYHEVLNSWLEIKGSSNSEPFGVYLDQLKAHAAEADIGFPTNSYLYLLFGYNNRKRVNGKVRRVFSDSVHDRREAVEFLAGHTQVCYIVDIRVLSALGSKVGTRKDGRHSDWAPEGNRTYVPVTRAELRELAENPRAELRRLGLSKEIRRFLEPRRGSIDPISISLKFRQRQVEFQLFLIVPTAMRKKIESLILGNGNGNGNH